MLVKLARNWFAPDGVRYRTRDGLAEIPEELRDKLPSDARIVSETGTLPSDGPKPIPGFGAKPVHEQTLDLIPGAAPTHQMTYAAGSGQNPAKEDDEMKKGFEDAYPGAQKILDDLVDPPAQEASPEEKEQVKEGLKAAKAKEDAEAKVSGDKSKKSSINL